MIEDPSKQIETLVFWWSAQQWRSPMIFQITHSLRWGHTAMAGNHGFAKSAQKPSYSIYIFLEFFWTSKFGPTSKLCQKGFSDDISDVRTWCEMSAFFRFLSADGPRFSCFCPWKRGRAKKKRKKKTPNRFFGYSPKQATNSGQTLESSLNIMLLSKGSGIALKSWW